MGTENCWVVLVLAVGAVTGLATAIAVGNVQPSDATSGIESPDVDAFDAPALDAEGSGMDTHLQGMADRGRAASSKVRTPAAPNAWLEVSPDPANPNETVTLDGTNSSTDQGDIVECDFDVDGDGTYDVFGDDDCLVTHQYNQTGQYEVAVRVRDTQQRTDVATETLTVAQNKPPDADFTWSPPRPSPGESIDFAAQNSTDPDGDIVEYRWDFDGDGSTDRINQTPGTTHEFADPGTYPVTLVIVDDDGATDSITWEVEVGGDPVARCSVSATEVDPDEQVVIDASDSDAERVRFDLDGDGDFDPTNYDFRAVVMYSDPGNYTPVIQAEIGQRTDVEQCPTIAVEPNEPPTATFTVEPDPGTAGEATVFDASDSVDLDGEIVEYRWDFDNDDQFEHNTTEPTVPHIYEEPGSKTVHLQVVDDDGATDIAVIQGIEVRAAPTPGPDPSCSVSKEEVLPDEQVLISASGELKQVEFDLDGDGTYDESEDGASDISHSYDKTGVYRPRVRVVDDRQRTDVIDCGTITVIEGPGENQPPVAEAKHLPETVQAGETVVLDASDSFDPDGDITVYRWDLDNDGDFDRETTGPIVNHTFEDPGRYTVRVAVEDDAGAVDVATIGVDASDGICGYIPPAYRPSGGVCEFIPPLLATGGGVLGGHALCRLRPFFKSNEAEGLTAYAAGMFELPADGNTVQVSGLGFEPDLVLFTASNAVVSADAGHVGATSVGWSYGVMKRTDGGNLDQHAVNVSEDARYPEVATAAATHGNAVYLAAYDEEAVGGVSAEVERTTEDGFELSVAADAADQFDGRHVVLIRAFKTAQPADIDIGYFRVPTEPSVQSVDITSSANHVTLTACTALDDLDTAWATESSVGLSTGEVVGGETLQQVVTAGTVVPSTDGFSSAMAADGRAIDLLYQTGPGVVERTTARATSLDEALDLQYDAVHADGEATPSSGPPLISYAAMNAGDAVPAVGHFELPGPEENGDLSVTTGFEPGLVEFTVCDVANPGERRSAASPFPWGRSHGVAVGTAEGVDQYLLHGAVDPDRGGGETSPSDDRLKAEGVGAGLAANGGSGARITGRDVLEVAAFRATGFDVHTTHVSTDARDPSTDGEKLVIYKAWPNPEQ